MLVAGSIVVRYCKECGRMSWRMMKVPYAYSFEEYAEFEFLLNEQTQCPYCGGKTRKFRDVSKPIKKIPINKAIYKGEPFLILMTSLPATDSATDGKDFLGDCGLSVCGCGRRTGFVRI